MPLLPFAEKANIPIRKLLEYSLNESHEEGKNKAYVFKLLLGFTKRNAEDLKALILNAVLSNEATEGKIDRFGRRCSVDFQVEKEDRTVFIRTGWIIKTGEIYPILTTCFILKN